MGGILLAIIFGVVTVWLVGLLLSLGLSIFHALILVALAFFIVYLIRGSEDTYA